MSALASCEKITKCEEGFVVVNGECKAIGADLCGAGTVFEPATKKCELAGGAADVGTDDVGSGDVEADADTGAAADAGADTGGAAEVLEHDGTCVPDCVGKECGDDGCGGSCGGCQGEDQCSKIGHCVPKAWTCPAEQFEGSDGCHCGCGAKDLDCDLLGQPQLSCGPGEVCDDTGKCVDKVPQGWQCPDFFYDDKLLCHCNCGMLDPDCENPNNLIADCSAGGCNKVAGVCGASKPMCSGAVCGDDGCGGSCGTCSEPSHPGCSNGKCVAQCTPNCSGKSCGNDGCGGTCGTCKVGAACSSGSCVAPAGKTCVSHCGYQTVGGCWCDAGCVQRGDCCIDVDHCFCTPSCEGKICGDNGCGGSCGQCKDANQPYCDAGKCSATCKPSCANKQCGDDGCGGTCGTCSDGASCSSEHQCVPKAWYCDAHLYATAGPLATCDCGCGAPDPDCQAKGPITGCPSAATCDAGKGTCAAKWCASQSACAKPSWCVGDYAVGDGTRKGVCAPPNPIGYAPGHPCVVDESCATSLCVAGSCRIHCVLDKDCPNGQACVGDCGTCGGDQKFCQGGQCVATCEPSCGGKQCGDDGCGGSCGTCTSGTCSKLGACVPAGWTCDPVGYNGDGVCDCNCGIADPDCSTANLPIQGCKPGELCGDGKTCSKGAPTGWTCEPSYFDETGSKVPWVANCDCGCGAPDPDCADPKMEVVGCGAGFACNADGTCGACQPKCDGKTCGPDGCGKTCGVCADPASPICQLGNCVDKCKAQCADHTCGPDGCGGSCGTCKGGESCAVGHCQKLPEAESCAASKACGKLAPAGCSCSADCVPGASCCLDVEVACGCQPNCQGKQCGTDGCGGSCGTCGANEACENTQCVKDLCKPDPCGGKGTCAPSADGKTAVCTCVQGFTGETCGKCVEGYIGFPDCKSDLCFKNECNKQGTCDGKTGACVCKSSFSGQYCHSCLDAKKVWPDCDKPLPTCFGQSCNGQGVCDTTVNKCECNQGFAGDDCGKCANPDHTYPQCSATEPKGCTMTCKGKGACIKFNTCLCLPGFTGANCELCADKAKTWPDCGAVVSSEYAPNPALTGLGCDFCGVPLKEVQFTADPSDKEPPQLKILLPPEGVILAPGMPVVVNVDDVLDPSSVTPATFRVSPASNAKFTIAGTVAMQITPTKATVLVFFPANLNVSGAFVVTLDGVKDKGGNAMAKVESSFQIGGFPQGSFAGNQGFEQGVSGCYLLGDSGASKASDNMTPTEGKSMLAMSSFNEATIGPAASLLNRTSMVFCGPIDVPSG